MAIFIQAAMQPAPSGAANNSPAHYILSLRWVKTSSVPHKHNAQQPLLHAHTYTYTNTRSLLVLMPVPTKHTLWLQWDNRVFTYATCYHNSCPTFIFFNLSTLKLTLHIQDHLLPYKNLSLFKHISHYFGIIFTGEKKKQHLQERVKQCHLTQTFGVLQVKGYRDDIDDIGVLANRKIRTEGTGHRHGLRKSILP